jgi:cytoskeletal protein RodZ
MIESGVYDAVPDELYLVPFIHRYAQFLGLDPQKMVSRFLQDFEKAENDVVAETWAANSKDTKTPRISLLVLAALFVAVPLAYIGSRTDTVPWTGAHPGATASASITHDLESASRPSTTPAPKAESRSASTSAIQGPAQNPAALTRPMPVATPEIGQHDGVKEGRLGHDRRSSRRRRHQAA